MRVLWASLVWSLLATAVPAAPAASDFSAGFERLREMARIPDLSKAEAGTIANMTCPSVLHYALLVTGWNGATRRPHWKLGENRDGSLRILLDGLWPATLYPVGHGSDSRLSGEWSPLTRASVAQTAVDAAEWTRKGRRRGIGLGPASGRGAETGRILLQAALLHAAGDRATASRIADLLLADQDLAERAIAGAFGVAAERRCLFAMLRFSETGDKPALAADMHEIRRQFSRNLRWGIALDCLIGFMEEPEEPSEAVLALPPEDQRLVAEVIAEDLRNPKPVLSDWLLCVPPDLEAAPDSALARLLRKGLDAIPILQAMADDHRATRYLATLDDDPSGRVVQLIQESASAEAGQNDGDGLLMAGLPPPCPTDLPELLCPLSAGGLAMTILKEAASQLESECRGADRRTVSQRVLAETTRMHRLYCGLSRADLARNLLAAREQGYAAIQYLLARPRPEVDYARINEAMLRSNEYAGMEMLEALADVWGKKAYPVIDREIKGLKRSRKVDRITPQLRAIRTMAAGTEGTMDQFRDCLGKAARDPKNYDSYRLMWNSSRFGDRQARASVLLSEAAATEQPDARQFLLASLGHVVSNPPGRTRRRHHPLIWEEFSATSGQRRAVVPEEKVPPRLDLKLHAPSWRKILPGICPPDSVLAQQIDSSRTPMLLFLRIHDIEHAAGSPRHARLLTTLPGNGASILFDRVQTILAGGSNPPWPDPAAVPPKRTAELAEALAKLPAVEARRRALDLPPNEYLALVEQLPEHEDLVRLLRVEPGWTLPAARPLGTLSPSVRDAFAAFAGKRLSAELGGEIMVAGNRLVAEAHSFVLAYRLGPGLQLDCELASLDPDAKPGTREAALLEQFRLLPDKYPGAGVHTFLQTDNDHHAFAPLVEPGSTGEPTQSPTTADGLDEPLVEDCLPESLESLVQRIDMEHLLEALDSPPETLANPMRKVSFVLVGLDEKACERLYAENEDDSYRVPLWATPWRLQ